jgi:membrane associated rhomboid family serine protease
MRHTPLHRIALLAGASLACIALNGCIIIGGSSRHGGFFLWPRGFGLLILVIVVIALMRPRRW